MSGRGVIQISSIAQAFLAARDLFIHEVVMTVECGFESARSRRVAPPAISSGVSRSKFQPHQGKREVARRAKRMAKGGRA